MLSVFVFKECIEYRYIVAVLLVVNNALHHEMLCTINVTLSIHAFSNYTSKQFSLRTIGKFDCVFPCITCYLLMGSPYDTTVCISFLVDYLAGFISPLKWWKKLTVEVLIVLIISSIISIRGWSDCFTTIIIIKG